MVNPVDVTIGFTDVTLESTEGRVPIRVQNNIKVKLSVRFNVILFGIMVVALVEKLLTATSKPIYT